MDDINPRKTFGVYGIRNLKNGSMYIGSCRMSFWHRWSQHLLQLRKGVHHSRFLQRAWDKYGEGSFEFSVLEVALSVNDLIVVEQRYIDQWLTTYARDTLYNVSLVAGASNGGEWTEERRAQQSERTQASLKVRYQDPIARARQAKIFADLRDDPEVQQRLQDNRRSAAQNTEYREKQRQGMIARWKDPDQRRIMSENTKRAKNEPESRARHSAAMREMRQTQPGRFASGERQGMAKLSRDQVLTIRDLYKTGKHSQSALARMFGVVSGTVHDIVRNKTWKEG